MHTRSRPAHLKIQLPAADHRVFVSASRLLQRIMGEQAPDVKQLVESKLRKHDATGLAEDYLDLVGWAHADRQVIVPLPRAKIHRRVVRLLPRRSAAIPGRCRAPADPSRN